ncbi:casein kinase 2 regulatory subunit [Tilletia horrida]|nr:casein kinase 2 regulatory subunit [Tilletia horrida]
MSRPHAHSHASPSSPHAAGPFEGDADVDVGLKQWAGGPHQPASEQVTAHAEAAVGEEEEEEDSEVLEEDEANAMYGREEWDPQNDRIDLPPGEDVEDPEEEEEEEKSEDAFDDYEEMLDSDTPTETITWIKWFCSLPGHEFFAEVDEDFIEDDFNLTGLSQVVPFYKEALEMILDVETVDESHKIPDVSIIESSAELLYGLIHQRYITTRRGLQQMLDKFEGCHFGACPRVFCHMQPVLPCGRSDLPGLETVKLYCPNCMDCYQPPSSRFSGVDGAYFGTTFPHLFLQTYREHEPSPIAVPSSSSRAGQNAAAAAAAAASDPNAAVPSSQNSTSSFAGDPNSLAYAAAMTPPPGGILDPNLIGQKVPQTRLYTPRIYGFKVSEHAKSGPRMRWMRMRPTSLAELEREGLPAPVLVPAPAAAAAAGDAQAAGGADAQAASGSAGPGPAAAATGGKTQAGAAG